MARETYGELVQLLPTGDLKSLWKRGLPDLPHRVFLSPQGHVVLDTYAGHGQGKHALVIYHPQVRLVADYDFNTLVPNVNDRNRCGYMMSGPSLSGVYDVKWTDYASVPHLALRDPGGGPTFDLVTGKLKTGRNERPGR